MTRREPGSTGRRSSGRVPPGADISGEYYPWHETLEPEQPWLHDYSQTLVMKLFLCSRDGEGKVDRIYLTFAEALEVIQKLDMLTLGMPKIVYLVGWQFTGHDSGFPSWSVVNEHLKRPDDETALQSLKWLIREARRHHTVVSLHLNMYDAFEDSPLWDTYYANNVILKHEDGRPIKGKVFDGMQSFQISYAREWELGLAQKRIDELLRTLPELKRTGTVHMDAFHSTQPGREYDEFSSPYLGYTVDDEISAQRKILRYWRRKGIDVTAEGMLYLWRKDPFIGLQPMAWWFWGEFFEILNKYVGEHRLRRRRADEDSIPATLCTGTPMRAEQEIMRDPERLTGLLKQFCTKVVPWFYFNSRHERERGVWAEGDGEDVFLPAFWLPGAVVAYSEAGYLARRWRLPKAWRQQRRVLLSRLTIDGLQRIGFVNIDRGAIELGLAAGEAVVVQSRPSIPVAASGNGAGGVPRSANTRFNSIAVRYDGFGPAMFPQVNPTFVGEGFDLFRNLGAIGIRE